jgi:chromosome segregation ATPase
MTTNEPSTEEIVRNFRGAHIFGITQALENRIADRLESQEQTIADKDAKIATLTEKVEAMENDLINFDMNLTEMTARAEQAERERDAAVADLKLGKVCMTCKHDEKCRREVSETNQTQCIGRQRWTWRGLPQEGEGV